MNTVSARLLLCLLMCGVWLHAAMSRGDEKPYSQKSDVIYGRKNGMALTCDVFTPKENAKGIAVIFVANGGWYSDHTWVSAFEQAMLRPLIERGYTVFGVVTSSQPKFTIPEIVADVNRAVRFVRSNAERFGISPDLIGIYGASAGGHLSLMQGLAGDEGNKDAMDPVDKASSRVQAVAAFYPPTDFLNYGKEGENAVGRGILKDFFPAFDFHEPDPKTKGFKQITDEKRINELGVQVSPITHVSKEDPPILLIHGDADKLVPIQQSEVLVKKLTDAGVKSKLVVKEGAAHGWGDVSPDLKAIGDWFDENLKK